ncbi:MAG: hypothetical protein DRN49_04235, partial [Thaumarchaeota archaeon]
MKVDVDKYVKKISPKLADLINTLNDVRVQILEEIGTGDLAIAKTIMVELTLLCIKALASTVLVKENEIVAKVGILFDQMETEGVG